MNLERLLWPLNRILLLRKGVITRPSTIILGLSNIKFHSPVMIDDFVFINASKSAGMEIGPYVHIAVGSSISGAGKFVMREFSGLSQGSRVHTSTDDYTSGGFGNPTIPNEFRNVRSSDVILERFAIIGANTVVLPGVKFGEGSSVGANSVISRNVPAWQVVGGVNKVIGRRDRAKVMNNLAHFFECYPQERERIDLCYPK